MDFFQICTLAIVAVILILTLEKHEKQIGMMLGLLVCCVVLSAAVSYLRPVSVFLSQLEALSGLDHELIGVLLKAVGIGIVSEIANMICVDSGNSSLGKAVHLLGISVILWLSIPLFSALLELLQEILGEL